ncbi:MAG: S46 family peptidase, partial [Acidobacteriota bacterium]|nr:S46 family peptidase [Acidobacteriota bacterium]
IQQVSDKDHDYVKNGFYAPTREQEIKVPGLILFTLMDMLNVTTRVNGAVKKGATDKDALKARETELDRIVDEMQKKSGLHCEQVDLYQGGEYWIYSYKKHDDVRLVFAPEEQIASFGGDPDNFTFPRHDIDFSIFRVYENGKPYTPPAHLKWTKGGLKAGDLTFVAGHPGSSGRLQTYAQMAATRDTVFPLLLKNFERRIKLLQGYAAQSPEHARQVNTQIFGLQNSFKAVTGYLKGLQDTEAMAKIQKAEKQLRAKAASDPELAYAKDAWTKIEAAENLVKARYKENLYVNTRNSTLLGTALTLVRMHAEAAKPDEKRLPEFKNARLPLLKMQMGVKRPFFKELEITEFTDGLKDALEHLGPKHPFMQAMLGGKSPEEVAKAAVEGSALSDPAARKALMDGGQKAVDESKDTMILLAKKLDPIGRKMRKLQEESVNAVVDEQGGRIARARFAVLGKETFPDATFTLRLTYGDVRTYRANGTKVQPFTTLAGLYDRAWGWGPTAERGAWELPPKWVEHQKDVDMATPLDFVHAMDIIGGNSGSPVVDKKGE